MATSSVSYNFNLFQYDVSCMCGTPIDFSPPLDYVVVVLQPYVVSCMCELADIQQKSVPESFLLQQLFVMKARLGRAVLYVN